jgi:hypothetical protein
MSDGEWRIGREFAVVETIMLDGYKFTPGIVYTAQSFGRIGIPHGRLWALGTAARRQLMDVIMWADAPAKISPVLRRFIEQDPESPFIRVFVRTEVGVVPSKKEAPVTAEKWFEYIEKAEPPKKRVQPVTITNADGTTFTANAALNQVFTAPGVTAVVTAPGVTEEGEIMMPVRVDANQRVTGRTSFSRTDYWGGSLHVPAHILAQGENEVREWVMDNITDCLDCDSGDIDYYDDEVTDSGPLEICENNIANVIRDFRRLYPELWRRFAAEQTNLTAN